MTEIQIRAHQLQRFPEQGDVFADADIPAAPPVQMYRYKGSNFVINQLPPGVNLDDYEPYTPQAQKTIRYPLDRIRNRINRAIMDGELPPDTDVEALAQHLFETKNVVEPLP